MLLRCYAREEHHTLADFAIVYRLRIRFPFSRAKPSCANGSRQDAESLCRDGNILG